MFRFFVASESLYVKSPSPPAPAPSPFCAPGRLLLGSVFCCYTEQSATHRPQTQRHRFIALKNYRNGFRQTSIRSQQKRLGPQPPPPPRQGGEHVSYDLPSATAAPQGPARIVRLFLFLCGATSPCGVSPLVSQVSLFGSPSASM